MRRCARSTGAVWPASRVLRSLVSFIEMIALMFSLHRRNGARRGLRFLAFIAAALGLDLGLGLVIPYVISNVPVANIVAALLVFGLGIGAMRLGLGKAVWRYHGAEHKAVNAYEGGADIHDLEQVARYSRVHDRCGTNLAVIVLLVTLVSYFVVGSLPLWLGGVYSLVVVALALEFFRLLGKRPSSRVGRVFLAGGRALQRSITTAEPGPEHLKLACDALECVLALEVRGAAARRAPWRPGPDRYGHPPWRQCSTNPRRHTGRPARR